ncbi:multicopper oxidase [Aulographum hederae CBS 113979]|uniref:Multicopper oxidase n=1 Tax=Aulographum hederae CBS 113979 TaxID=1176131 RepID=A0A6G1GM96_9PEZI|nr:multicopper oxidase [Aulographum hederae CBS 113979]
MCQTYKTSYPASRVSSACKCLSVKTSTATVTVTAATATRTTSALVTATSTKTCAAIAVPTASTIPGCVPCEGQPGSDPDTWCGLDINTNYYKEVPKTCRIKYFTLNIQNITVAPDGVERMGLVVNGGTPGPAIEASWGDTVVVKINNEMPDNGTSIHFHGVRQNYTNMHDGVVAITQCPIAPGDTATYQWVAEQYGTSWYHSHFALQAWEGVVGPMIIHGPHSAEYDTDAGMVMLADWNHRTIDSLYQIAERQGPRVLDNGLINGKNIWNGTTGVVGERFELPTKFQKGKKYLLRVVNTSLQSTFKFYLDGHTFTVISTDFTPIVPYQTKILNINIGERYNLVVEADQPVGDYFMRSDNQNACAGLIQALDIKGIVRYEGSAGVTPTSTAWNYTSECVDEPLASLVPIVPINAGTSDISSLKDVTISQNSAGLFKWFLSGTTFMSHPETPTLLGLYENGTAPTFSGDLIIDLPDKNKWVYLIIETRVPLPHPIHLHGHDFHVLAQGRGTYDSATVPLNLVNPARRDTSIVPGGGYQVIAFETDNPGAWLMHCHVGWHTSMGFAIQFVEMASEIPKILDSTCQLEGTCANWAKYVEENNIHIEDSGV